jgi:hypothetical protein
VVKMKAGVRKRNNRHLSSSASQSDSSESDPPSQLDLASSLSSVAVRVGDLLCFEKSKGVRFVNQIHQHLILEGGTKGAVSIDATNTSRNPIPLELDIDVLAKAELIGHNAVVQCRFPPRQKLITQGMCARITLRFWCLYDYQSSYAVIVRDIHSTVGPILRPITSKLSRTTSGNSPLLLMAFGLPFMIPAPYW